MSGRGLLSQQPVYPNNYRLKNYNNAGAWVDAVDPYDSNAGQVDSVSSDANAAASCAMPFGERLASLNRGFEIGLVPCAKGGSNMAGWNKSGLSRSTLYGSMIARAQEAAAAGTLAGVVWWIGTNDTDEDSTYANTLGGLYEQFIADVRSDLSIANLPFVIAVNGNGDAIKEEYSVPSWDIVQAQQRGISSSYTAKVELEGVVTFQANEIVHCDTPGLGAAGRAFADEMHTLI